MGGDRENSVKHFSYLSSMTIDYPIHDKFNSLYLRKIKILNLTKGDQAFVTLRINWNN